ncbi:radical SAM family heme chaperone HemW [bacterium]|nr:radical SAM family heme chaperone HemW [bacterium]
MSFNIPDGVYPSLYVHVPFCLKRCPYCAFYKRLWDPTLEKSYLDALEKEVLSIQENSSSFNIKSLFIGGGTPNSLTLPSFSRMLKILSVFKGRFEVLEKTVEMNPEAVTPAYLRCLETYGYTRVSLGIQSFDKNELKLLGRIHNVKTIYKAVEIVKDSKLLSWNMDFMFGFPDSDWNGVRKSLDKAMEVDPPHISLYALTIEKGTLFEKHGIQPVVQENDYRQYQNICRYLKAKGYLHYEVSAFAKPGHECSHNKNYWTYGDFIGVGPSADSYLNGCHSKNTSNFSQYVKQPTPSIFKGKLISDSQKKSEFILSNLRLISGFLLSTYRQRFGSDVLKDFEKEIEELIGNRWLRLYKGRLQTTKKGLVMLNEVLIRFV